MPRASKICSWRDPDNPGIGCAKVAVESPQGENFRCQMHWRKPWSGQSASQRERPLTEAEKNFIRERDWHVCRNCGEPAHQVDHIVEYVDGGTRHPENLQLLCDSCHMKKTRRSQSAANQALGRKVSSRANLKRRRRMMGFYEQ